MGNTSTKGHVLIHHTLKRTGRVWNGTGQTRMWNGTGQARMWNGPDVDVEQAGPFHMSGPGHFIFPGRTGTSKGADVTRGP